MAIFTGVLWIVNSIVYPETYAPVLLRKRAAALSKKTGKVYVSKLDPAGPKKSVGGQFKVALSRPWQLLFKEPIVLLTSLYMAIIYGTLYLCFAAFPIVFQKGRGWSPGIGGLAFIGIAVGMTVATIGTMFDNKRYKRVAAQTNGMAPPEARLPPALVGSVLLPIGLFWFAWTNGTDIHWVVPIIGSAFFAAGIVLVFLSLMNYIIDSCRCAPGPLLQRWQLTGFQTSYMPRRPLPPIRFFGRSLAPFSPFSRHTCTKTLGFTGRAPFPHSSRSRACRSLFCFTSTAAPSA